MATTCLYRISSGEVTKIATSGQLFADRDTDYWGVLSDPSFPDGLECRDEDYNLRVLGFSKIQVSGTTVRNAIQAEIDTFEPAEAADEDLQDAKGARDIFLVHPRNRKKETAFADIIKDEINILRGWTVDFKAVVAAANNLNDMKTGIAALPTLNDRTLAQLKLAITNRISEDD